MKTCVYRTKLYGRVTLIVFPQETDQKKFTLSVKGTVYEAYGENYSTIVRLIDTADRKYPGIKREMKESAARGDIFDA